MSKKKSRSAKTKGSAVEIYNSYSNTAAAISTLNTTAQSCISTFSSYQISMVENVSSIQISTHLPRQFFNLSHESDSSLYTCQLILIT